MLIFNHANKASQVRQEAKGDQVKLSLLKKRLEATKKYFAFPAIIQEHHATALLKATFNDHRAKTMLQTEFGINNKDTLDEFTQAILNKIVI
jgi:hypothetical protein